MIATFPKCFSYGWMLTTLATSQNSFKKEDIGGFGHPNNKDLTPPPTQPFSPPLAQPYFISDPNNSKST